MAWCESCAAEVDDDEARRDAEGVLHCPNCDSAVVPDDDDDAPPRAPWHFKVLVVGTVIYLIYRAIWFIFWLRHHA